MEAFSFLPLCHPLTNFLHFYEPCTLNIPVVLKDIEGVSITEEQFANLQSMFSLPDDQFIALYAGLLLLVRCSLRPPVNTIKKDTVCSELTDLRWVNNLYMNESYATRGVCIVGDLLIGA